MDVPPDGANSAAWNQGHRSDGSIADGFGVCQYILPIAVATATRDCSRHGDQGLRIEQTTATATARPVRLRCAALRVTGRGWHARQRRVKCPPRYPHAFASESPPRRVNMAPGMLTQRGAGAYHTGNGLRLLTIGGKKRTRKPEPGNRKETQSGSAP